MKCPPVLADEAKRLRALSEYGLGGKSLPSLEPVVRIAARMFNMPVAAVNMIGREHVFLAASSGLELAGADADRDISFCAHAIARPDVMVVPDATCDERFFDNPLVTGSARVRFYAGVPLMSPDGHALGALCVIDNKAHHDFSCEDQARLRELAKMAADRLELRRIEMEAQRVPASSADLVDSFPVVVVQFDVHRRVIKWSATAAAMFGYEPAEGLGLLTDTLIAQRDRSTLTGLVSGAASADQPAGFPVSVKLNGVRKDGTEIPLGWSLTCLRTNDLTTFEARLEDLTARQREQEEMHRLANIDVLTGLPNRACFYRRTEEVLGWAQPATVILTDLDGFKDINAELGHVLGDRVLREVALRLEKIVGTSGSVARIGGDEFAILLPQCTSAGQAKDIANASIAKVAEPLVVDGHEVHVTINCGIAVAPAHAQEAVQLISNADLALSRAKNRRRGQSVVFNPTLRTEAVARRHRDLELHRAVSQSEFALVYQPQFRLADGALTGAEALIRWLHPQHGLLSPAAFLPALESGPLAATVGAWVLDQACAQAAMWRRYGARDFRIGVNLFGAQFRADDDIASQVLLALERHGLPPEALELEITEGIVLDHDDLVLASLQRLRDLGVGIAFDDFGTGYASLSLLKRYPLSRIKIDRSFVQGVLESDRDAAVIRAILHIAQSFDIETTAEGIETEPQRDILHRLGCNEGQGYLFGRPVLPLQLAETFGLAMPACLPL